MEELLNKISLKLNAKFSNAIISSELLYDFPVFTINSANIHDVIRFLKEDDELNFHFLTDLTGAQTADEKQLSVIYHLHNMPKNWRVRVKTYFDIIDHNEFSDYIGNRLKIIDLEIPLENGSKKRNNRRD